MKKLLTLLLLTLAVGGAVAQRTAKVSATYDYYVPADMTRAAAEEHAIEMARTQAIAKEFPTIVSATNMSFLSKKGFGEHDDFMAFNESDVRGEWLEDSKAPVVDFFSDGHDLVCRATVQGVARELKNNRIDIDCRLLYNGTDPVADRLRNFTYHVGDYMYVYFTSPVDGYLAIYLSDDDAAGRTMQCLLPYRTANTATAYPIVAGREYVFFSPTDAAEGEKVARLKMNARSERDINQLYVLFSPNAFARAADTNNDAPGARAIDGRGNVLELMPRELPFDKFQKWLLKSRRNDPDLQVAKTVFVIEK